MKGIGPPKGSSTVGNPRYSQGLGRKRKAAAAVSILTISDGPCEHCSACKTLRRSFTYLCISLSVHLFICLSFYIAGPEGLFTRIPIQGCRSKAKTAIQAGIMTALNQRSTRPGFFAGHRNDSALIRQHSL